MSTPSDGPGHDALDTAYGDALENDAFTPKPKARRFSRFTGRSPRTRSVIVATGLLAVTVSPFAVAATGSALREGTRNGTATRETQIISRVAATNTPTGGYSTRQSNLSSSGGGAVYGCRTAAGGSAAKPPQNPCLRANNLSTGYAFEFNATRGAVGGLFSVGAGGDAAKPFITNATGVATGLNADRVDGLDATQVITAARTTKDLDADKLDGKDSADFQATTVFAQIGADGAAGTTRGVPSGGVTNPAGLGTYSVVFDGDRSKCAFSTAIAGADSGQINVAPTVADGRTTVAVETADSGGVAADRAFHVTVAC